MLIPIDKIVVKDRIRQDFGNIQELIDDIRENGLINPPVVNKNYELLAGERRLKACKSLGWEQIPVTMMDTRDAEHELNIEISENDVRKGFSKAERADYMKRLLRIEQAKAKERQSLGKNSSEGGRARDIASNKFGVSHDTMKKEIAISENKGLFTEEDFADWDEGKLSTNKAYQKMKAKLVATEDELRREQAKKQQVKEVVPDDYEKLKEEARLSEIRRKDFLSMKNEYNKMTDKWKKSEKEKESLLAEMNGPENERANNINRSALFFCAGVSNFIEKYGGYVWLTQELDNMDQGNREGYIRAINAVDAWVQQMKENMGV